MRKFMPSTLGAILVLAVITGSAGAANFTDTFFGISIDVDDTLSKQPQLRDIHYFKSQDRSASLMIKRIHDLSVVEFAQELRDTGYRNMRDHIMLGIAGEPIEANLESGRGLLIPVRGRIRGHQITGLLGAFSGHGGQGFLVIGTARPQHWAAWNPRMKTMLNSVQIIEVDREAMVREWENWLMGKKLQYQQPRMSGRAMGAPIPPGPAQPDYYLCSDGTVMNTSGPGGRVPGTADRRGMSPSRGTWNVIVSKGSPYLIVRDGREQKLMLEVAGDDLLVNGKRYIATANDLCQ